MDCISMESGKTTKHLLNVAKKNILWTAVRPEILMEHGEGMYLWDTEGRKYLDFIGGWAVTSLGHCPEQIKSALAEQSAKLINASPSFYNVEMIKFAELLISNSCFDRVFFASSGAEANEGAIKLARKYGSKMLNGAYKIITTKGSFHGRTLATMAATGKEAWKDLYEPKAGGFIHVPLNDFDALTAAVDDKTCAVMIEPIQGEGGVHEADHEYISKLHAYCKKKKILLIFDEVQTGVARTGKLFAYEHYGIEPDVMTLAKGIGGGYPLAALLTKEYLNIFEAGDQGGTYSSQPLGMAVGLAVMNEVIGKKLWDHAADMEKYLKGKLGEFQETYKIHDIRGKGLLLAFDLPDNNAKEVVSECLKDGLIINSPGPSTVRLIPPLIVEKSHVDEMISILSGILVKMQKQK